MSDLPEEAVQAATAAITNLSCEHEGFCFECEARAALEAVAPILAAQVRRETAEQLATAIVGTPKPPEAYWRAWAARIAREIGEGSA